MRAQAEPGIMAELSHTHTHTHDPQSLELKISVELGQYATREISFLADKSFKANLSQGSISTVQAGNTMKILRFTRTLNDRHVLFNTETHISST